MNAKNGVWKQRLSLSHMASFLGHKRKVNCGFGLRVYPIENSGVIICANKKIDIAIAVNK